MYVYTHASYTHFPGLSAESGGTPGTMSTSNTQILVSKCHSPRKETCYLGEMAASEAGVGEEQDEPGVPFASESMKWSRVVGMQLRHTRASVKATWPHWGQLEHEDNDNSGLNPH